LANPVYIHGALALANISLYDINVISPPSDDPLKPDILLQTLTEFRYELRKFLHFSEDRALKSGLHPQQHQLLLQVAGAPDNALVNIAYVAGRLGLKHNSTVELVDRSEAEGLLERSIDPEDRRRTILLVTRKGRRVLNQLTEDHAQELSDAAPRLALALEQIRQYSRISSIGEAE
jgi:DNA-binding MarR family transcriptional regulator